LPPGRVSTAAKSARVTCWPLRTGRVTPAESLAVTVTVPLQARPERQVEPGGQVPQLSVPPQPSAILPQNAPAATHVVGAHPHPFGVPPPPHVCGAVQVPQFSVPPQLSLIVPQAPLGQVAGVQQAPVGDCTWPAGQQMLALPAVEPLPLGVGVQLPEQ